MFDRFVDSGFAFEIETNIYAMLAVVFIAGIIRGFAGFGSALLTVPALSMLYEPAQAVVIAVLIEIPTSLGLLPIALRGANPQTILPMLIMCVLFVPVGTLLLTVINPEYVKIFISLFVLVMVVIIIRQKKLVTLFSPKANWIVGAVSGTSQGLTGMAGPLFATALLARNEEAPLLRANIIAIAAGLIATSAISLWGYGLITVQTLVYAVVACPVILLGLWVGTILFRRLSHWNLRWVILVILVVTAIAGLYRALIAI